jgi:hypothetical protein
LHSWIENDIQDDDIGTVTNETLRDVAFRHRYGRYLFDANEWLNRFTKSKRTADLHQAWDIYYNIFKKIETQVKTFKKLELHHLSPALTNAYDLKLVVPGTYKPLSAVISIKKFSPSILVIQSKQRPRRMSMIGSDGVIYPFLLKGNSIPFSVYCLVGALRYKYKGESTKEAIRCRLSDGAYFLCCCSDLCIS